MDPLTHGLTGIALSYLPPKRQKTMLVMVVASLAPDFDYITRLWGVDVFLRYHRGITHGILAVFILPLLLGVICHQVFRKGLIYYSLIAFLGYSVHIMLDLTNQYPTRVLSPLDWGNYSMSLSFIIDPYTIGAIALALLLTVKKQPAKKRIMVSVVMLFIMILMIIRFQIKARAEDFLRERLDEYQYILCPLPNDFLRWWFVTRSGDTYRVGFVDLFSRTVSVLRVAKYDESVPEIKESKELRTIRNFLFFAQAPLPEIRKHNGKAQVLWRELTYSYIPGDHFVASVEFDKFGRAVKQEFRF